MRLYVGMVQIFWEHPQGKAYRWCTPEHVAEIERSIAEYKPQYSAQKYQPRRETLPPANKLEQRAFRDFR